MFSRRMTTKLLSNFSIYTEKPTQYVRALFNLTQPVWVATGKTRYLGECTENFNLTQPVWVAIRMGTIHTWTFQSNATARVATAELHNRRNALLFTLRNICLFFYPIQWSYIIYCNGITSFHFMKANKNTVTSQRDGGISILKYLFAFIFWYNLSIFTLQQKARKTASRKFPFAAFLFVFSQTTRP